MDFLGWDQYFERTYIQYVLHNFTSAVVMHDWQREGGSPPETAMCCIIKYICANLNFCTFQVVNHKLINYRSFKVQRSR